jgi:hypothetical protein
MSEIQTWQPMPSEIEVRQTVQDVAIQRLGEWARSADAAHQIAGTLVQTSFCPEAFRNKPGEATAAILAGLEVGLQPMAALRSFDVIQGTAAPRAITLRAIVQSHGHEIVLEESTASRCKMKGRRRGTSEWSSVVWTIDRAKQLGVTNKPNWRNQPQAMLVARATSELARLIASDAILGIGYSAEEIADGGNAETQAAEVTTTPSGPVGTRRMSRPRRPIDDAQPLEPVEQVDEAPPTEHGADAEVEPITPAQIKMMAASMGELGMTDRDSALAFVADVVGRAVESRNDLTKAEATKVIDALQRDLQGQSETAEPPLDES